MKISQILALGLLALSSSSAFGWGQKGHDTVVAIAENHFTDATRAAIDSLLDGKSPVYYANWLDNASHTPEYAYSKTWHYKNIDADKTYENAPNIKEGNIVQAIYEQTAVLQNPNASKDEKALALKMIVHFLGDIHQPMHMGHASDLGGNKHYVKYFRSATNLHTVWDSRLPESAHKWSYSEWVNQIDRATPDQALLIVKGGNPDSWGKETYEICKRVYETTPVDTNIEYDYISDWTPTIENQFLKGGLRLADLLNSIFDPNYQALNSFVK
ncbi:MAG: S1/P1 nuclease [Clostridium sp.]|nr:S1/P1 nuclease [Prevotella sp.]MCM1428812.1 S1/P1 nuclease [Clostridium sp.]MCM1475187.1 S1/P1 nuclease [Muribaculaceae bacterium]